MIIHQPYRVFVSYTGQDLDQHAAAVASAIRKLQHVVIDHKDSGATGEPSVAWCMEQVDCADILVVLVAYRYGWIPGTDEGGDGVTSITWMEVRRAREQGKPVLPYLVDEEHSWPPKHIEATTTPAIAERLNKFKAELKKTVAGFFTSPSSLDGPISRDVPRAVTRIQEEHNGATATLGEEQITSDLFKSPTIYVADCGVSTAILTDLLARLEKAGFSVIGPNYSGYYLDVKTEFYKQCHFGILAMGPGADAKYAHVRQEEQLVYLPVSVYLESVDMTETGFGAPLSGQVLNLEDWKVRPEKCFAELLVALRAELLDSGWTPVQLELPDIELVNCSRWSIPENWRAPLRRAGFSLYEPDRSPRTLSERKQLGRARFSVFAWGHNATHEDAEAALLRARRYAAVIAIADRGALVPDDVRAACKVFDLSQDSLNKSPAGTSEWEEMLQLIRQAILASNKLAASLG